MQLQLYYLTQWKQSKWMPVLKLLMLALSLLFMLLLLVASCWWLFFRELPSPYFSFSRDGQYEVYWPHSHPPKVHFSWTYPLQEEVRLIKHIIGPDLDSGKICCVLPKYPARKALGDG
jgi:hypothetical protein